MEKTFRVIGTRLGTVGTRLGTGKEDKGMDKLRREMEFLEFNAHIHYGDELGTYYWGKFLILENTYNAKSKEKYKRRW